MPSGRMIGIHQQAGVIQAYVGSPGKTEEFHGGIILVHELWGLTQQIKTLADRLAAQGYYVLAPDLYSTDQADRRPSPDLEKQLFGHDERLRYQAAGKLHELIAPTQTPQSLLLTLSKLESCFEYVYNQPLAHQRVAIIGFGTGGKHALELSLRESRLKAVISFYGSAPHIIPELRHIKSPVLAFYGGKEKRLAKELEELVPHMRQAGVNFTPVTYPTAGHAFFNEAHSTAYDKRASDDAWRRSLDFLMANIV